MLVRVVEGPCSIGRDPERILNRQLLVAAKPVPQALAFNERHGEPKLAVGLTGVEDCQDMGVLEPRGGLDLALEFVGAQRLARPECERLAGPRPFVPRRSWAR